MPGYFSYVPQVTYQSFMSTDIMTRVKIKKHVVDSFTDYYIYTIPDGQRPDVVAAQQYNDSTLDWLIYLLNDIIDPYYDWPLGQSDFDNFIIQKYGSFPNSDVQIVNWTTNWYGDDSVITLAGYASLPANLKKYWSPIITTGNRVTSYKRRAKDLVITTNQISQLSYILPTGNNQFSVGDILVDVNNSTTTAEVCWSSANTINVKNVIGSLNTSSTYTMTNLTFAGNTANMIANTLSVTLPIDELVYYNPVTALNYEIELNQAKTFILLLQPQYTAAAVSLVAKAFAGI